MNCTVSKALLPLAMLVSCTTLRELPPEAQAVVDCVTTEASLSGRPVSVFVDEFRPGIGPRHHVFGPETEFSEANELVVIYTATRSSDGKYLWWARTGDELMSAIFTNCDVEQVAIRF